MNTSKTLESGRLEETGDTWLLITPGGLILVDIPFIPDMKLEGHMVTIIGKMGVPVGSTFEKLIAERIISHETIARKAYELHLSNRNASAEENWFQVENELLRV